MALFTTPLFVRNNLDIVLFSTLNVLIICGLIGHHISSLDTENETWSEFFYHVISIYAGPMIYRKLFLVLVVLPTVYFVLWKVITNYKNSVKHRRMETRRKQKRIFFKKLRSDIEQYKKNIKLTTTQDSRFKFIQYQQDIIDSINNFKDHLRKEHVFLTPDENINCSLLLNSPDFVQRIEEVVEKGLEATEA